MRILITSGATREPIDAVRFLSNVSTGRTGALLADALTAHGHVVTLLHGEAAVRAQHVAASESFSSTTDLQSQLRRLLGTGNFDAVIHAAAVSDYRPSETRDGKMSSYATEITLRLVPTPKLLPELKQCAPHPIKVIGFKLTAGADTEARSIAVSKLFAAGTVDAVIHNDMDDLATGDSRPFSGWRAGTHTPEPLAGIDALTAWLHAFVSV
ncbi:phosphopantothenoylcysteine decarboxylase [Rariglobus hedericola]|uniref:Phosphopantothenoylcysteine decarboxylase n=1 Tax=Rariglobus hedericola TaxID=2597822 RepID=A0A556QSM3_9BACT|nr:phosphopantothenoylcysteine decarboxylase [Rariglobus hedericola]TSJ79648.1 phosphopantothenoylcysteine decarboxylase [Rariglobus hedericola]